MRLLNPLRRTLVRFEPIRVFLALLIAVLIWLYPVLNHSEISRSTGESLQEYGRITLVTAVDAKAPNCSNACKINVCTKWIALGEPGCPSKTNPWDIGCCLSWEIQCDPDCVDPTPTEPPTISGVLNCTQSNNGWCTGSLTLNLSASDPQGASVLISGILNGTPFACPNAATSCSIPITSEGAGTISYRVDSATSLFATGSTSYTLDLSNPQINASLLGTSGANNYYISTVTVSASASDAASGVQSFEYSLDNGGNWSPVSGPLDFNDGDYTLLLRATDQAGWSAQTSTQSFSVDTTTPLITISATSTPGNNGWRISPVQFNASASDAGSGLASLTCEVNSAATDCASITLADGIWQVHVTACDRAGLCSDETRNFNVDTTTPTLTLSFLGDPGQNNWYTSAVQVTANASDTGSGIDSLQKSLDGGGTWSAVLGPITFTGEGLHLYQLLACDKAGLCTDTGPQQVQIDTIAPMIHLPSSWVLGETAYYNAEDHGSGLDFANTRVEGRNYTDGLSGTSITSELYWNGRDSKGKLVPPGEYDMVVKVFDQAGNEAKGHTMVEVNLFSSLLVASLPEQPDEDPAPASSLPTAASSFGGQTGASTIPPQTDTSTTGNSTHTILLTKDSASFKFGVDSATAPVSDQQTGNILWGAAAAALVGATLADWQKKREEEQRARAQAKQQERREKQAEYDRINRAYQAALDARKVADLAQANSHAAAIEAKLAREDAAEEARFLAAQNAREQAAFDHRMSEHDGDQVMVEAWKAQQEKQTAAKVLAMPAKDDDPPKWWEILDPNWTFQGALKDLFGDSRGQQQSNTSKGAIQTVAVQTAWAQITQTFLPTLTPAPTATPTPLPTSTPTATWNRMIVVADGLNLRLEPNLLASLSFKESIPHGGVVYVDTASPPVLNDGYCWVRASYIDPTVNARAIAASPEFLNPLNDFRRWTPQGAPIDYFNAMPKPWLGIHIGEDYVPLVGGDPNPVIRASATGTVIASGNQPGYGNYVIIEYPFTSLPKTIQSLPEFQDNSGNSLYAIYGHMLEDVSGVLTPNDTISAGMELGRMGQSGNGGGLVHLHFELRVGYPHQDLNANSGDWYQPDKVFPIDPALIVTPNDTSTGWAAQYQCTMNGQQSGESYLAPAP